MPYSTDSLAAMEKSKKDSFLKVKGHNVTHFTSLLKLTTHYKLTLYLFELFSNLTVFQPLLIECFSPNDFILFER